MALLYHAEAQTRFDPTLAERALILQGGYRGDSGRLWRAGDVHEMDAGTVHAYQVSEHGTLFALALAGGFHLA